MSRRPFRFGVLSRPVGSRREWIEGARAAADLGYAIWLASDHFSAKPAPIPALAAAAEATSLRVGTFVLANDFRHPAVVAKETATIDLLSDGRFELGLGTGWLGSDYEKTGIPLDPPGVRVERLIEAVHVIKGIWSGESFSHHGTHYRVEMEGAPVPVQDPHPPLLIGGSGPRMIRFAARSAQIVSLTTTVGEGTADGFWGAILRSGSRIDQQVHWVREAAGDDLPEINVLVHHLEVTERPDRAAEKLGTELGVGGRSVLRSPHVLVGTLSQIEETLLERRERHGISYVVIGQDSMHDLGPVVGRLAGS